MILKVVKKKKRSVIEDIQNDLTAEPVEESQPSKPKKKKKSKEDKLPEFVNPPSPVSLFVTLPEAPAVEKRKKVKSAVKDLSPEGTQETPLPDIGEMDASYKEPSEEESTKRKRRRRKRRSHHTSVEAVDTSLLCQQFEAAQLYVPPALKERQHVHFGEDSDPDAGAKFDNAEVVLTNGSGSFKKPESNGNDKYNRSNVGEVKVKGSKTSANKPAVYQSPSAASNSVLPQLGALLSLRSAVFSRNSSDKVITPSYNNVPPPPALTLSNGKILQSSPQITASEEPPKLFDPTTFPIIKAPPRLNDLIAFKV